MAFTTFTVRLVNEDGRSKTIQELKAITQDMLLRHYVVKAKGNVTRACALAGTDRTSFHRKLAQSGFVNADQHYNDYVYAATVGTPFPDGLSVCDHLEGGYTSQFRQRTARRDTDATSVPYPFPARRDSRAAPSDDVSANSDPLYSSWFWFWEWRKHAKDELESRIAMSAPNLSPRIPRVWTVRDGKVVKAEIQHTSVTAKLAKENHRVGTRAHRTSETRKTRRSSDLVSAINAELNAQGLSLCDLSERLGTTELQLRASLRRVLDLSMHDLWRIADALGLSSVAPLLDASAVSDQKMETA